MHPALAIFKTRAGISFVGAAALAALLGYAAYAGYSRGVDKCEKSHKLALAEAERKDHANYLAAVEWGNQISTQLAAQQRKTANLEREYLAYAHAITGHCPHDLGVLVGAASRSENLPAATGPSAGAPAATAPSAPPIPASILAANIAVNYSRLDACVAGYNALIDWHQNVGGVK